MRNRQGNFELKRLLNLGSNFITFAYLDHCLLAAPRYVNRTNSGCRPNRLCLCFSLSVGWLVCQSAGLTKKVWMKFC